MASTADDAENSRRYELELGRIARHEEAGCCGSNLDGARFEAASLFAPYVPRALSDLARGRASGGTEKGDNHHIMPIK